MSVHINKSEELRRMEIAKSLVTYDKTTGLFKWIPRDGDRAFNSRHSGATAGSTTERGYVRIQFTKKGDKSFFIMARRLAWFMAHGKQPAYQIDHVNGVFDDNRISNLRDVTGSINSRNKPRYRSNKSGVTGVSFNQKLQKWVASARYNGTQNHLGCFSDFEEAARVSREARAKNLYTKRHTHG